MGAQGCRHRHRIPAARRSFRYPGGRVPEEDRLKRARRVGAICAGVAGAAIGLGLLYLHSGAFRGAVERRAEAWLTEQLGRESHLSLRSLSPLTLRAEVAELSVAGAGPGAPFLLLDRGTVDLAVWPLVRRRFVVSELALDGLALDLAQAPSSAGDETSSPAAPLPSLADLLNRITVERATLTGGGVRVGDATWPVEIDGRGIGWHVERLSPETRYRLRLDVREGTARLAGGEWFAIGASAEADLDAGGLRVGDVSLSAPGAQVSGHASLDDLPTLSGSIEGRGNFDVGALPWPSQVAPAARPSGTVETEFQARFAGPALTLSARLTSEKLSLGQASAEGVDVRMSGAEGAWTATLAARVSGADVRGTVDGRLTPELVPLTGEMSWSAADVSALLPLLAELGAGVPPAAKLRGQLDGRIAFRADALDPAEFAGEFIAEARDIGPRDEPEVAIASRAQGTFEGGALELASITARGAGLTLSGQGRADLTTRSELDLELLRDEGAGDAVRGLSALLQAAGVASKLPPESARLSGELRLTAELRGPGLDSIGPDSVEGQMNLRARGLTAAGADAGLPVDADIRIALDRGRVAVRAAEVQGPGVRLTLDGTLDMEAVDASVALESAAETGPRLLAELSALGVPAAAPRAWIARLGEARLDARLAGPWNAIEGTAKVALTLLAPPGPDALTLARAVTADARLDGGALEATIRIDGGDSQVTAALHTERYDRWPLPGTVRFEGVETAPGFWAGDAELMRSISGRIEAQGTVDLATLQAQLTVGVAEGLLGGSPFELGASGVTLDAAHLQIEGARLRLLGGDLQIDGALGSAGAGLRIRGESLRLADILRAAGIEQDVGGTLGVQATFTGTPADPHLQATVTTHDLALQQQRLTDLTGELTFGAGVLVFDLAGEDGAPTRIVGQVQASAPQAWSVEADYPVALDLRRFTATSDGAALDLQARIVADLRGSGSDPTGVEGRVELQDARLALDSDAFVPRGTPVINLANGRGVLEPFVIDVAGAALKVRADVGLDPTGSLSAAIEGPLPLRALSSQIPGVRLDGVAELALLLGGTPQLPEWRGTLNLKDGRLDHPDLPAPLERINAELKLAPEGWSIDPLTAQLGGGHVSGSGTYRPAAGERRGDLQLQIEGTDVRLPPIEGLRSQIDADVRLSGAPAGTLTLAGRLEFDRAVYGTDIDLQRELLGKTRIVDSVEDLGGVLDRVRLDLQVEAPGTLFVRNNLASLQTSTSLRIAGTAADPLVTGRVELQEGGRVVFRDVTYNVARGTLDYTADPPDNPRLDIEGRTSVGTYDISLLISGRLEDPQVELSSSPPVSQADIVSLLVTGRTREDLAASGAGISEAQAALYLGQGITREIERTLARSLGLDQVTLDPTLVAAEDDPAARLTVGKALTGRLFASYSREFGGTQGDIYQLRFTPAERLSFVGQHDDQGEFLGDALYERKFYMGPPREDNAESETDSAGRISRIHIEGNVAVTSGRLSKVLGLRVRDPFRRARLLDGLDAIRDLYLQRGYPEAIVDARVDTQGGGAAILVVVEERRKVEVRADGPMADKLKAAAILLWQQSVFRDEIATDARQRALELLAGSGYINATVEASLVFPSADSAELRLEVDAGPRVKIDRVAIEGNAAIDSDTIRQQFLSLGDSVLRRDWLRPRLLEEDREAVRSLYFARGYLDARVEPLAVTYPRDPRKALVSVKIVEGPKYDLGRVLFTGNSAFDDSRLREVAELGEGRVYLEAEVRQARGRLRSFYDENGHPETQITVTRTPDPAMARADVLFTVEEAPHAVVESIAIDNPGLTRDHIITDKLDIEVGDPLSADKLASIRQELYRTGLFRSVSLTTSPGETEEGRQINLKVDERSNVRTQVGLGYGTDQGVRGSFAISHANLGGERLYGSAGARASRTDWRLYGLLRQPDLFHTKLQGLASSSIEQEESESFDVRRKATSVQIEPGKADSNFRWFVGYGVQEADIFRDGVEVDPGSGEVPDLAELIDLRSDSPLLLADLNFGVTLGKRDDFAWPTRGNLLNAKLSIFDSLLLSEAEFVSAVTQWSLYRPLGSGKIWSAGVRLGLAQGYGGQQAVPLSERFFAGGDNSIRGFRRDSIIPVGFPQAEFDAAGIEVTGSLGGEASLIFNQELVVPFFNPIAVVAFHDAGNLYWRRSDLDPGNLRHTAGLGLRVRTPVGPIRLEYGWKLDRQVDEESGRLHFSIGVPF